MLDSDEILTMRETAETALPDTAERFLRTLAGDGAGGWTESWTSIGTSPCRLVVGQRWQSEITSRPDLNLLVAHCVLPAGFALEPQDRLVVNGNPYRVTYVPQVASWAIVQFVRLEKLLEAA